MVIPARCNKRSCQARRNLSKTLEEYVRRPRCHVSGCSGFMYIDKYRFRRGPKDNVSVCRDSMCQHFRNTKVYCPIHRVSTKGCSGYPDYLFKRNNAPRSKHSPIPKKDWVPF